MIYAEALFANLPLQLVLVPEGKRIAVTNIGIPFALCDEGDPTAYFDAHGFSVDDEVYEYGTLYSIDTRPKLRAWLTRQNIQIVGYGTTIISS